MSILSTLCDIHANMDFSLQDVMALDLAKPESWLIVGVFACLTMASLQAAKALEVVAPKVEAAIQDFLSRH